ncbi:hypothetical protein niasHT_030149 [Heterodera trifolii]|uniref:Uncharacterized protein n=1 Tax=Heterodera trifolii TaxID=157864 RepID=A0ABD2K2P6_9BILA
MELLNDDSLICVFNELHFLHKIPLESVWSPMESNFETKCKVFNIAEYVNGQRQNYNENDNYQATISGVIGRAGPHIREFDFGQRWPQIPQSNHKSINNVPSFLPKMRLLKRLNLRKFDEALDELAQLNSGTME